MNSPQQTYAERLSQAQAAAAALDRSAGRYANGRGLTFVGTAVFLALAYFGRVPPWGYWAALASAATYVLLAVLHGKVLVEEARAGGLVRLNQRGLDRLSGKWRGFAERGDRFKDPAHLNAPDLDLFGQGSLFQLLNESGTRLGEDALARTLQAPEVASAKARAGAVAELAPEVDFRQAVVVECLRAAKDKADPAGFIRWAEEGPHLESLRWARPLAVILPLCTLALFVAGRAGTISPRLVWLGIFAQLLVVTLTHKRLTAMYQALASGERGFVRFEEVFALLDARRFRDAWLGRLVQPAEEGRASPRTAALSRFGRLFSFAELRQSGQLHALLNVLLLWDVHVLFLLEGWRARHGTQVRGWFGTLAELEGLCCLATFAYDRPDHVFPEWESGEPKLLAKALGHPLLDRPVRNDVAVPRGRVALVVTGSNMSGKSTLVRAIGINVVLAQVGAPVCATSLRLTPMRVLTSMRVTDSLEEGVSFFYAEVKRLKAVLDAAREARGQALFLLDEILLGTNTRERQIAAQGLLRLLLATGASGAVTTHDLSLAEMSAEPGSTLHNVHFRDILEDGRMTFDYRLREGVVDTTNALKVLRLAGIELPDSSPA